MHIQGEYDGDGTGRGASGVGSWGLGMMVVSWEGRMCQEVIAESLGGGGGGGRLMANCWVDMLDGNSLCVAGWLAGSSVIVTSWWVWIPCGLGGRRPLLRTHTYL